MGMFGEIFALFGRLGSVLPGQKLPHVAKVYPDKIWVIWVSRDLASKGVFRGPARSQSHKPMSGFRKLGIFG
jgi:hypothetical protein